MSKYFYVFIILLIGKVISQMLSDKLINTFVDCVIILYNKGYIICYCRCNNM